MQLPIRPIQTITLITAPNSSFKQRLAVSELQRGLYQLGYTGRFVVTTLGAASDPVPDWIGDDELRFALLAKGQPTTDESYDIAAALDAAKTVAITGANDQALLYGVFDLLERQGACFGIDGDVYPIDAPKTLHLPEVGNPWHGSPRMRVRGLLPWPDFLNCITVYNREDFRAYLEAMLRMRFNTLGIHVYTQKDKWAESFLSFEYCGVGHAAFTDTTATDRWGYLPQRTSRYSMSASQYFDDEVFGTDATRLARNPWEAAEFAQSLWREAFNYADQLGIRTGVGFEPYQLPDEILRAIPPEVHARVEYDLSGKALHSEYPDLESRTARHILEARLARLLEAYPSVTYVYLWEDELVSWASQKKQVDISPTPFKQSHDFLRRHASDKRLVVAGWGGVARHFEFLHRALPEDVIFTCLSDQVGWDPVNEVFAKLGDRERWPIPWLEDDPAMWFPQLHVHRFARDIGLAEQYGCQGMLGIHWRHRIVDINANFFSRRLWDGALKLDVYYQAFARTQASNDGERAKRFGHLLDDADIHRRLLSTWNGEYQPDGRSVNHGFSGDYGEAFTVESGFEVSDELIMDQANVIAHLNRLFDDAASPIERERLGYWLGQMRFLDPYSRAWKLGVALHKLITAQHERRRQGDTSGAAACIRDEGVPMWMELLKHMREAVLSFQHTVATRNDLGMLASIHNKFIRIAAFRMRESLLEFLSEGELPSEAQMAWQAALAPDTALDAAVIVPTRPTRLSPGERVKITAVAPGVREVSNVAMHWHPIGSPAGERCDMQLIGRRTYAIEFTMPSGAEAGIEYYVEAAFANAPDLIRISAPPQGKERGYLISC